MKRTAVAVVLAVAALAMLTSLVLQSRSLPLDVHLAQNTIATELGRVTEDYRTLVATLESEWAATQAPGEGARALGIRIAGSPAQLKPMIDQIPGNAGERERLDGIFGTFSLRVEEIGDLTEQLFEKQTAYVENVDFVRDEGPRVIQQMRDLRLDEAAANAFQLVVGTLDFATPRATVQEFELRRLLTGLQQDERVDANMPREVERLGTAIMAIVQAKGEVEQLLQQIADTPLPQQASRLTFAAQNVYQGAVASGEQARFMLSIYSVALLLAVGLVAFRLQSSYRQINRANAELAQLNESLEQRVADRTDELAGTLKELKESQVQLVQAEKMSSLGQLVAGISHEINTPLLYLANNAVLIQERLHVLQKFIGCCSRAFAVDAKDFKDRAEFQQRFVVALKEVKGMLAREDLEASVQEAHDLTQDSIEGLEDLTEMAQSLKDFSRLDRAPVASFDVNGGLDKTLIIARNIIKHKAEVRKFYGELPEIQCSPSQVNQVFLNLITNAAQAIQDQGEIVITTKRRGDDHVAISIADTGCGIPPEIMDKIRDPFFTTKEVGSGTGLGLSIVDEIIRSHDGQLEIESEPGRGSVFTVILPVKRTDTTSSDDELLADLAALDEQDAEERGAAEAQALAEAV
ncbi:MAG: GHKL domain-containing protein [Gammaproteobacteria bacterium]|nr:GHKL domain-containing protein [Gammaproteobacteria bacterium]